VAKRLSRQPLGINGENIMDNRELSFQKKFESAAQILGSDKSEIVSIKLREHIARHTEYMHLLQILELLANISQKPVKKDLQGDGYVIENNGNKIIIVEHETGPEILYIAGSIASLVGLIPLIIQIWRGIKKEIDYPHHSGYEGMEIRKLNKNGKLNESHDINLSMSSGIPTLMERADIGTSSKGINIQLQEINSKVNMIIGQIDKLEHKQNDNKLHKKKKIIKKKE
jgi:hypothetical protein